MRKWNFSAGPAAIPEEVLLAYDQNNIVFGPNYIIPKPFDPRLLTAIPPAVAKAAENSGVARKPIKDDLGYRRKLAARLDRTATLIQTIADNVKSSPKKIVFAEGEQETVIRAAMQFYKEGYGQPVLIGVEEKVLASIKKIGLKDTSGLEILNANISKKNHEYFEFLYNFTNVPVKRLAPHFAALSRRYSSKNSLSTIPT